MRVHVLVGLDAEQGVPLPLPQVRLRLHGHEQSGRPQAATREIGQYRGGRFSKVHAESTLRWCTVPAFRQTDSLSLSSVPVRRPRPSADVRSQVSPHGHITQLSVRTAIKLEKETEERQFLLGPLRHSLNTVEARNRREGEVRKQRGVGSVGSTNFGSRRSNLNLARRGLRGRRKRKEKRRRKRQFHTHPVDIPCRICSRLSMPDTRLRVAYIRWTRLDD